MSKQQNTQPQFVQDDQQTSTFASKIPPDAKQPATKGSSGNSQAPYSFHQQQHLMETAAQLLAASTPAELWPIIITAVGTVLMADRAAVFLYDTAHNRATCPAANGLSEEYIEKICSLVEDAPSHVLWSQQKPDVINDISADPRTEAVREQMTREGFRAYAVFPLITAEHQLLGAIFAYRDQPVPFSPQDIAAGQTLANISTLALQNSLLHSETRLNLIREQHLNQFTRALANATDLPAILGEVIHTAANITGADAGLLGLVIDHQVMTFYPHNIPSDIVLRPLPRGRGIAWQVVKEDKTIKIQDYPAHYLAQDKWVKAGVVRLVAVPITAVDNPLGALMVIVLKPSQKQFSPREVALLESIGHQTGIAIQNSRMFAEATQRTTALRNALNRQAELDDLKDNFVQNVSHELRTPLGIIHGHIELLSQEALGKLLPPQAESIQIIQRRVQMLIDMVNDLTALLAAETQELRREEINPVYLAYSTLDEYRLQARELNIHLNAEIEEELPHISGDITNLRRVFDNLVSNAFKFTPEEGTVTIRVWEEDKKIVIEVADTGIGIPQEKLPRVFDRFYQVDGTSTRRYPGTGLGLALVKEIIEAHRGEVAVRSELGEGTTFRVTLPVIANQ